MVESSVRGVPPLYLAPVWDETQFHARITFNNYQ